MEIFQWNSTKIWENTPRTGWKGSSSSATVECIRRLIRRPEGSIEEKKKKKNERKEKEKEINRKERESKQVKEADAEPYGIKEKLLPSFIS